MYNPQCFCYSRRKAKDSTLLSSRVRYVLEPTEWPTRSKASCGVGERTRDCSPGHAGREGPQLAMTGASCGFSRVGAQLWVFSRGTTGSSGSLSCGARKVRSLCVWRGGAHKCSRVMVGKSGLKTRWRRSLKVFLRLWQETMGSLDSCMLRQGASQVPMWNQGYCGVGSDLSELHWVWWNGKRHHL